MSAMPPFDTLHPSALRQSALPHWVAATPRARGALRYRCPKTGSFVLLTDPTALAKMSAIAERRCIARAAATRIC